jgi:hypothetical protein
LRENIHNVLLRPYQFSYIGNAIFQGTKTTFNPIPELARFDGDMAIYFMSGNGAVFVQVLGMSSLASQTSFAQGIQFALANNQWQLDVLNWWDIASASFQASWLVVHYLILLFCCYTVSYFTWPLINWLLVCAVLVSVPPFLCRMFQGSGHLHHLHPIVVDTAQGPTSPELIKIRNSPINKEEQK